MTIGEIKYFLTEQLKSIYSQLAINTIFNCLMEKHLNLSPAKASLNFDQALIKNKIENIKNDIDLIKKGKPYQYVIGYTWFYNLKILVDASVLIPRPETEELVDWMVNDCKTNSKNKIDILDIGTGSGCIALALKSNLNANLTAVDISESALNMAQQNAQLNNLKVHFEQFDVLNYIPNSQSQIYDIIISNPPYIGLNEKPLMNKIVTDYEPDVALFTSTENPLIFYEQIARFSRQYLKPDGSLYFELNENFPDETKVVVAQFGFKDIIIKKDLQGKPRMLKAKLGV